MNLAKRLFHGLRGAFDWDNPCELLLDYHLLRRRDPIRLRKYGAQLIVDYKSSDMTDTRAEPQMTFVRRKAYGLIGRLIAALQKANASILWKEPFGSSDKPFSNL